VTVWKELNTGVPLAYSKDNNKAATQRPSQSVVPPKCPLSKSSTTTHPSSLLQFHINSVTSLKTFLLDEICTHTQTFTQFHILEMLLCITGHNYGHQFHFFANSFDSQSKPSYKPCPWVAQVA
jgi:hypothetical protein